MVVDRLRPWQRFHVRITALYGAPVFLMLGIMGALSYRWGVETEMAALRARIHSTVVSLASTLPPRAAGAEATPEDAAAGIAIFERVAEREPDLSSIYLLHETSKEGVLQFSADWVRTGTPAAFGELYDGTRPRRMMQAFAQVEVEHEIYADKWGLSLSGYAPVRDGSGKTTGIVGADVTGETLTEIRRAVLITTLTSYGVAGLLIGLVGWLVGQRVREPLERIIETSEAIASGRLDARTGLVRHDELGLLAERFDAMAAGLEEREYLREVLGKYVSEDVARKVLSTRESAGLVGEEREITILFADLVEWVRAAETLSPEQVVAVLNRYAEIVADTVEQHGGCSLEIFGDGVLAVFGAPERVPDHAQASVACVLDLEKRVAALDAEWEAAGIAQRWRAAGIPRLSLRVGLHLGRVVAGNMGGNNRMKYAVIGDAVNVAARVDALNSALGTRLLLTRDVHERLSPELAHRAQSRGEHAVKGREQRVWVFTLDGGEPE
jgi:adenylate cyclase